VTLIDFFDAFTLPFVVKALATIVILSVAAGVVGLFISFRDLEFVTDGLVHAVFPGLVIGYIAGGSAAILPGALIAALVTVMLLAFFSRSAKTGSDATIAVLLTSTFSLGIVFVSRQESYVSELESLLFGHLLTVTSVQLVSISAVAVVAVLIIAVTRRTQLFRAHDVTGFQAAGFRVLRTDLWLSVAVALLVVAGVQALGNLLVVALLIVPMAAARQLTSRIALLVPVAILVSLVSGVGGLSISLWASFAHDVNASAGAVVVLLMIVVYAFAAVIRVLWPGGKRRRSRRTDAPRDDLHPEVAAS
jgi:zinc/manganese transport system permease protein